MKAKYHIGDRVKDTVSKGKYILKIVEEPVLLNGKYNYMIQYPDGSCAYIDEDKLIPYMLINYGEKLH